MFDEYAEAVVNRTNFTNIRAFSIFKLFGRYNVSLRFDKEVNIYVGENGLGKTTILNCLYAVLNKKFSLLEDIDFLKIEISFRRSFKDIVYLCHCRTQPLPHQLRDVGAWKESLSELIEARKKLKQLKEEQSKKLWGDHV